MKKKKLLTMVAALAAVPVALTGCGHDHSYGDEYKTDGTHHWHQCECGEKKDYEEHENGVTYSSNETHHWYDCADCGYDLAVEEHTFDQEVAEQAYYEGEDADKATYRKSCVCGQSGTETFDVNKVATTLSLQMSTAEIVYGSTNEYSVVATTNNEVGARDIVYKVQGADDNTYSATKPTDAGHYTAKMTIAGDRTYKGTSATIDFEIQKFKLQTESVIQFEYNKGVEFFTTFDTFAGGEIRLDIAFNNENVGTKDSITSHTIKVNDILDDNSNFDISELMFEITKKKVSIVWQDNTTPFKFIHNDECEPTFEIEGVCNGDEIDVAIQKTSGDNAMYGQTFKFEALSISGANEDCYELDEATKESYTYTIADIEEVTIGQSKDIDYVSGEAFVEYNYFKVNLTEDTLYYFDYDTDDQGSVFNFDFYLASDKSFAVTREVTWFVGGGGSYPTFDKTAFSVETTGEYYIVVTRNHNDDEGTFTIAVDEHAEVDEYGFCTRDCGTYLGENFTVNMNDTLTLKAGEIKYLRFADAENNTYVQYALKYATEPNADIDIKVYRKVNAEGEFELVELTDEADDVAASFDDYYYIVATATANASVVFQIEQTFTN